MTKDEELLQEALFKLQSIEFPDYRTTKLIERLVARLLPCWDVDMLMSLSTGKTSLKLRND